MEPPWEGETKVCINGPGHLIKMATMPIYGKNLQKSSPELEVLSMQHRGLKLYKVCINVDHDLFCSKVKFGCLYVC